MKKGKNRKIKLIIAAAVVVLAGAGIYAVVGQGVEVSTAFAEYGRVEKIITETGTVEALNSVIISSKIQGQLIEIAVTEGDFVTEGQRLAAYGAGSIAADIGSLRAQISGLQAQAALANEVAANSRKLYEEGAMSYDEFNRADTAARQIAAQIASLNFTIAGLSEAGGGGGVLAPISGTVTAVLVREGELVAPGQMIIEISDMSEIFIAVNLVSEDADRIVEGAAVRVFSESERLIDEKAIVSKVFVSARDVVSDLGIVQRRVPVEITLSGGMELRLGSNVNVNIIADARENTLRVNENAIFEINRQHHVYIIENGRARLRLVETGLEGERYTEILRGLSEGDMIITSPPREIDDGRAVKF